ncbi:acyl-CoA-dependent ceramide synthase [Kwoniella mangroviensis CBS 10435]|uniref:Acyl-CoA-dependent ceramide synthase n=1 Tax=Kwoniella mangroviensis CBS 10435 TaxID=1331196 RepID=A0A1B9IIE1_9TREE|nr:acyl-CoA-dependent ceramide synthase [Kwoniella mangroviensis CBS 8507]OCF55227.1 acyl-CoA-dependent ceramide synthase [Kwoniella mangroviensis CBS 10435]OCF65877.1 acyl-CoA-dependent ceramide synthase [Kwoniella mangroviensis CBS 8507]
MTYNLTTSTFSSTLPNLIETYLPSSLHPFFLLSYPIHPKAHSFLRLASTSNHNVVGQILYDKGYKDIYYSISWAIIFTLLRSFTMNYVFQPFASYILDRNRRIELKQKKKKIKGGGAEVEVVVEESKKEKKHKKHLVTRFSEQGWSMLYCTVFWTLGMFTLYSVPSPTSPEQLWGTYPYTPLPALTKFYYLAQLGWWFHQIYVINTEKRRKDHWQMFGHHILTITLIVTSYIANFTRIGVVIHVLMDFCDIFLPLAKMLRYLSYSRSCDLTFVIFLISWLFSREIGLFLVIKTSYLDAPRFIQFKWSPSTGQYLTYRTYLGFIGLVSLLWVLASIWFYMAVKVAVKVVRGQGAEDSRSDDEDEDGPTEDGDGDGEVLDDVPQSVGTTANGISNGHSHSNGNGNADGTLKKRK